ncbi:hypothetical protein F5B17DRAFT_438599 [Nemania serpens]|nr:hypothetical protein F5B17DRAFT_438599 [Nemania serpens]
MTSPVNNTKKPRRVSFAAPNSPNTAKPKTHHHPHPRPHPDPQPKSTHEPTVNDETRSPPPPPQTRSEPSNARPPPPKTTAPEADILAGAFTHTVTNTPHGLVIDGVLQPRGPTAHSQLRDTHPFHNGTYNPSIPSFYQNSAQPHQVNMSTVGAGMMPDPYAAHYQPPVPDTTHGPFEYTYTPRTDAAGPQYMMMNGGGGGGPPFCAPPAFPYQQPQPGMATAPIPMMAVGGQPPFVQAHPMQPPMVNYQPGIIPPMAYAQGPGGPPYMTAGMAQPTPPITPPGAYVMSGGNGGYEMGKTKAEVDAENQYAAQHNQMNEPQSMKPADDDVSRMYWCRELDGQWIPRSRFSLDRMGNFRWYVTANGVFYAKMLPE